MIVADAIVVEKAHVFSQQDAVAFEVVVLAHNRLSIAAYPNRRNRVIRQADRIGISVVTNVFNDTITKKIRVCKKGHLPVSRHALGGAQRLNPDRRNLVVADTVIVKKAHVLVQQDAITFEVVILAYDHLSIAAYPH